MIVIGLTGSIGMGKTTAANMLREMKIPVHDSDQAVHDLLAHDLTAIGLVRDAFPAAFDGKTQAIDRKKLRDLLGNDHEKWDLLEEILHPLVQQSQQAFIRAEQAKGAKIVALDIPLLFETGAENRVDYTICVSAPEFIQRQRVLSRENVTEEDFEFRLSRQMTDQEKRQRADYIVPTGAGLDVTRRELQKIIREIKRAHGYGNDRPPTGLAPC